jgi:hypothetical protein
MESGVLFVVWHRLKVQRQPASRLDENRLFRDFFQFHKSYPAPGH